MFARLYRLATALYVGSIGYIAAKAFCIEERPQGWIADSGIVIVAVVVFGSTMLWLYFVWRRKESVAHPRLVVDGVAAPPDEDLDTWLKRIREVVGRTRPRIVDERENLLGPDRLVNMRFSAQRIEGRRVLRAVPLLNIMSEPGRNRLFVYLQTRDRHTYLTCEIRTMKGAQIFDELYPARVEGWRNTAAGHRMESGRSIQVLCARHPARLYRYRWADL
jgi:hypothetical protein